MTTATTTVGRQGLGAYKQETRVLTSLLSGLERRTLVWLAERMPARVNSDHLTLLALAAMMAIGASYWMASWTPVGLWLVPALLAVNWFGDSLDGTLARVRQQQRPRYGFYVDHVVDAIGISFVLGGLALSGYMTPLVALGVLVAYFLLTIEVYLATHALGTFRITFFNLGPTELRIVLALGTVVLTFHPMATIFGRSFLLFDVGGVVAIAGLLVTFVISAVRTTTTLSRAEPRPVR